MEEETYDDIYIQNETAQQTPNSKELLLEKEAEMRRRYRQMLALCFGTFCIFLVLGIIRVAINHNKNLTDQINNVSESKIHNLTMEIQELREKNQNLEGETRNLKEQIDMMKTHNELNASRAQGSIDEYCGRDRGRKCGPCQSGWILFSSSCYAYTNAKPADQKNWDEAQQDCKGKVSDLPVVANQEEKNYVNNNVSPVGPGINGYWIGLRAEGNKWKWIDGTELVNQDWITTAASDGQCVTSLQSREWKSVSCTEKNAWICEKKALSV